MIILFINLFQQTLEMGEDTLERIEEFMRIFFPAYWMTVGISSGVSSGLVYYQLGSLAIYLVELILKNILLPCCSAYMLFVMLNGLWGEERLELLLELWKKGMKLALRAILGLLTGASLIQSIITPVIDKLKVETAYQTVEAIPGVGNAAQGVLRLWMGSAVLIKNSVGAVSCILLLLLTLVPLLKIALTGGLLKLTAAVLGMVGDKRLIHCTNSVGDGILLLLQITSYAVLFFLVLVAITAYTTGGGM
jgi:stage III sporulation protein AE